MSGWFESDVLVGFGLVIVVIDMMCVIFMCVYMSVFYLCASNILTFLGALFRLRGLFLWSFADVVACFLSNFR